MAGKRRVGRVLLWAALCVALMLGVTLWKGAGRQMRSVFTEEVERELAKSSFSTGVFSEEDLAELPEPVARYFRHVGYVGYPVMANGRIVFEEAAFKNGNMDLTLYSEQYNFAAQPVRIAYLRSKVMGVIPFEGRDKFQDGKGFMTGKLAKLITMFDVSGREMDQAALATFLAEVLLVPSCAWQDYITWEEMDSIHAKATISYGGVQASGIFTIDENCQKVTFRTEDRYMDQGKAGLKLVPWRMEVLSFQKKNGLNLPDRVKALWELPEGDFVYFDGSVSSVEYDVHEL